MKRKIFNVLKISATALLVSNAFMAQAAYWDEGLGSYYAPNRITPGMTTNMTTSVCAQRNSDVTIPVNLYISPTSYISGASTSLGSVSVFLPFDGKGSFCSSLVSKTVTLPAPSAGNCYSPFGGYFIFQTGNMS